MNQEPPAQQAQPATEDELRRFRQVARGNVARGYGWTLTSDFECGNGQEFAVHGPDRASFCPEPDPVTEWDDHAYTYFFCARITNEAPVERRLWLEIRAPRTRFWRGWSAALESPLTVIDDAADGAHPLDWRMIAADQMQNTDDAICAPVDVPAGGTVAISHHFWYPLSRLEARLRLMALVRPDVQPIEVGRSAQRRPIAGLRLPAAAPTAQRVVLTGTPQASEGGYLACLWSLQHLLSSAPAVRAARERFTFDVVPATNPDGIVLGACMVNAVGQYIFYDAGAAAAGQPPSAETAALWRLVSGGPTGADAPAAGYLEYHSTFHTGRPSVSYAVGPDVFADPVRRAVNDRTSAALGDVSRGRQIVFARRQGQSTGTLPYLAAERYGTAAHLFKMDTGLGPAGYHAQVVEALERFLAALAG